MNNRRLTILALAPNPWDGPRMNRQHLFARLARRHAVVYSTGLRFFKGFGHHRLFSLPAGRLDRRDELLVDQPPSWLIRNLRFAALDNLVIRLASRRWRPLLGDRSLAYLFHPAFWPYTRFVKPARMVYHAYDLYDRQAGWCATFATWERQLIARADLVVASSPVIRDRLAGLGARDVMLLENAGDFDVFAAGAAREIPGDLAAIPKPRVAYAGAINQKVDLPLVAALAGRLPRVQFVLIGQVTHLHADMECVLEDLRRLPNVHLLGRKHYADLPAYVAHTDVNAIWTRMGEGLWTEGTYPLKLHEYLAAGPPVVASDVPALRSFAGVVRIARNIDEWERALVDALALGGAGMEVRREVAGQNTWDIRAHELEQALLRVADGRQLPCDDLS